LRLKPPEEYPAESRLKNPDREALEPCGESSSSRPDLRESITGVTAPLSISDSSAFEPLLSPFVLVRKAVLKADRLKGGGIRLGGLS
jgi:hypothetical protein